MQPTPYTPTKDFSQDEANNASGRSTVNTAALDAEFANIEQTLDETLANIALVQRDDGKLADLTVMIHTLSPEVLNLMGGFRLTGLWQAAKAYAVKDIATNGDYTYVCHTAHTSGVSFDSAYWTQFGFSGGGDAQQAAIDAQNSANAAATSATAAATSATTASGHATTATTQATNAATSASTATTQASNAATSATNAANSAAAAATSAANLPNASAAGANKFLKTDGDGTAWEYQTAAQARASLGATSVGGAVFTAASAAAALAAIGVSGQLQEATRFTAGGTADAITGTLAPAITSYTAGLRVTTTPGGANTVTGPKLNLNGLGDKTIKKRDSGGTKVALAAGDYNASGPFDFEYDGTDFILLNPLESYSIPAGTVIYFAGSSAPTGFIKANGAAVSRTAYAALFAAIGTTFGAGDGSTTFNVPDLRGEFIRGLDDGRGVDSGRALGSAQSDDFKSHSHSYNGSTLIGLTVGGTSLFANLASNTSSTGGAETRPRNVALLACIKY